MSDAADRATRIAEIQLRLRHAIARSVITEGGIERYTLHGLSIADGRAIVDALAAAQAEIDEWKAGRMADHTGHMFRCAKVNGKWVCQDGCAKAALIAAQAEIADLKDELKDTDKYLQGWAAKNKQLEAEIACLTQQLNVEESLAEQYMQTAHDQAHEIDALAALRAALRELPRFEAVVYSDDREPGLTVVCVSAAEVEAVAGREDA